jgi:hypothetical protein
VTDVNGEAASPAAAAAAPAIEKSQKPTTCDAELPKSLRIALDSSPVPSPRSIHARPLPCLVEIQAVGATKEDKQGHNEPKKEQEKETVTTGTIGFSNVSARGFNPTTRPLAGVSTEV